MQISIFNFNQNSVRVEIQNGEPLFCLKDVTGILNIKVANPERFNLKQNGVHKIQVATKGGNQELTFINEPNLYRVIFRSNKPEAVKFQDWIFEEVIPQIRKTGSYQNSGSLKTQTALPDCLTLEQQDEIKKFHRQLVQAAPKEQQAKLAITLWSSIKSKFGVSYKQVPSEHYPEVLSLMARVAVEKTVLHGEVLDKPQNHTVALPEFELVRIAQYLSKTYVSMQLFHELHRALCMVSPHFTKRTREEVENNLPLLRGIVHSLQDYSGSLKDPFFNQQFDKSMQFLGRITPQCLEFR